MAPKPIKDCLRPPLRIVGTSQPKNQSSAELRCCGFSLCDGSGYIRIEKDGYEFARVCRCLKVSSRRRILGEMFFEIDLYKIVQRNTKQGALKTMLLTDPRQSVFLYGPVRTGKSHFFAGIFNYWDDRTERVKFLNSGMLKDELRMAELSKDTSYFLDLARDYDHFFIEEVGKETMSEFHRSALFRFFDEVWKNKKHLVMTSNHSIAELAHEGYWGAPVARRVEDTCEIVNFGK